MTKLRMFTMFVNFLTNKRKIEISFLISFIILLWIQIVLIWAIAYYVHGGWLFSRADFYYTVMPIAIISGIYSFSFALFWGFATYINITSSSYISKIRDDKKQQVLEQGQKITLNKDNFKYINLDDILKFSNNPIFFIDNKNNIYTNDDVISRIWPSDNLLIKNRILKISKQRLKHLNINESHFLIDYYDIKSNGYLIVILRDISHYHYDKKITRHEIKNSLQNILIEIDSNIVDDKIKNNILFQIKKIDEYLNNSVKMDLNLENINLKEFESQLFKSINNEKYQLLITNRLKISNWVFDKNKIEQAIKNAILNSFYHAEVNKVNLDITADSKYLHFLIFDSGKGIDEMLLRTEKLGHSNIGFELINSVVQAHKNKNGDIGFITINSKKDTGTLVKISIPNMNKITKNYKTMYNINEI